MVVHTLFSLSLWRELSCRQSRRLEEKSQAVLLGLGPLLKQVVLVRDIQKAAQQETHAIPKR